MSTPLRIDTLFAFIAVDADGNEGVIAAKTAIGAMPLVGADLDRVESVRELAQQVVDDSGITVKLVHFTTRTELEVLEPEDSGVATP